MFSALKFVVAGVIVALFGGFLLAGVLTTPQEGEVLPAAVTESPAPDVTAAPTEPTEPGEPVVRTDILPGVELTVEEVEPGVLRVIDDGVRDLAKANNTRIVAGHDGGIWLLRRQRFFRLGGDGWHEWPGEKPHLSDFEVAPDGIVWTLQKQDHKSAAAIRSFDGGQWTVRHEAPLGNIEVTPDGTVWTAWSIPDVRPGQEGDTTTVFGYLDAEGWQPVGESGYGRLFVPGTGDIWATGSKFRPMLHRFIDGEWHDTGRQGAPGIYGGRGATRVGPGGTVWTLGPAGTLSRFDGSEWQEWSLAASQFGGAFAVAPDRSVWVGEFAVAVTDDEEVCGGGVGNFDGMAWSAYLADLCVESMDIASDGSVWLLATESGTDLRHVYVITPEAVAANE